MRCNATSCLIQNVGDLDVSNYAVCIYVDVMTDGGRVTVTLSV